MSGGKYVLGSSGLDLLESTRRVWEPRAGRPLSTEECREIVSNATGFFGLLRTWSLCSSSS
jgi:hypothetical protein